MFDYEMHYWYDECQENTLHLNHPQRCTPQTDHGLFPWQIKTLEWMETMENTQHQHIEFPDHTSQVSKILSPVECVRDLTSTTTVTSDAPGGLIASSVGTGKTAILVTYILNRATEDHPILVVVPEQVEQQWVREFERISTTRNVPLVVNGKQLNKKRKREPPQTDDFVVWRCNMVSNFKKPPPSWRVLLVTDTVVLRTAHAIRNKSITFDFQKWIEVSSKYAADNGVGTAFHDKRWHSIVYDEITEIIGNGKERWWMQHFFNTIPADHVWGLSSTPVLFDEIAGMLRMRRVAPIMQVVNWNYNNPVNATLRHVVRNNTFWKYALLARSIRFSTQVMSHVRVRHRIIPLQLKSIEREVLGYMRLNGMPPGDQLMICTDVAAFMEDVLSKIPNHCRADVVVPDEAVPVTRELFWSTMHKKVQNELNSARKWLANAEQKASELQMIVEALVDLPDEVRNISAQLSSQKQECAHFSRVVSRHEKQEAYIESLKTRVHEAENSHCPICLDDIPTDKVTVTPCTHVFCMDCLVPWVRVHKHCPTCRAHMRLTETKIFVNEMPTNEQESTVQYSTKICNLLTQLRVLHAQTDEKAIVFCDFPETVCKIQSVLNAEGIVSTHLVGNIVTKNKKLRTFASDDKCRVIFLHTQSECSGMDLYNANHIFFMNSVQSCDVVQQAIGRCARLSQTRQVNVTFFTVPEMEKPPILRSIMGQYYEFDEAVICL